MGTRRGLIIFPGALGDLVCLLPAIDALRHRYPAIAFELMAKSELAHFARYRMRLTAGHSIDRPEVALLFRPGGGESLAAKRFFGQFERIECFFASDYQFFCDALARAAGGSVSFYPFRPPGTGHVAACYLRAIGAPPSTPVSAQIELLAKDLHSAKRQLASLDLEPGRFVLVLPGSGSANKNWPANKFALLAEKLKSFGGALIVLGPAEQGLSEVFSSRRLPMLRNVELGELAAIARLARCFVGNDSGVSHLAAAAGARGLALFGPTDPERWHPLGDVRIVRREPLQDLALEEVWPALLALVGAQHF
jgi:heptosyltransferase-3